MVALRVEPEVVAALSFAFKQHPSAYRLVADQIGFQDTSIRTPFFALRQVQRRAKTIQSTQLEGLVSEAWQLF